MVDRVRELAAEHLLEELGAVDRLGGVVALGRVGRLVRLGVLDRIVRLPGFNPLGRLDVLDPVLAGERVYGTGRRIEYVTPCRRCGSFITWIAARSYTCQPAAPARFKCRRSSKRSSVPQRSTPPGRGTFWVQS